MHVLRKIQLWAFIHIYTHTYCLTLYSRHMMEAHSFFIPDPEFLINMEGLIEYLGAKVGIYFEQKSILGAKVYTYS